jgi:NAD dependent epimerase/dehydratase family enzyme
MTKNPGKLVIAGGSGFLGRVLVEWFSQSDWHVRVCHVPFGLPATRWMLEIGSFFLRTETELIIKSRRVVPVRLAASGFEFQFPTLARAVDDLEQRLALPAAAKRPARDAPSRAERRVASLQE